MHFSVMGGKMAVVHDTTVQTISPLTIVIPGTPYLGATIFDCVFCPLMSPQSLILLIYVIYETTVQTISSLTVVPPDTKIQGALVVGDDLVVVFGSWIRRHRNRFVVVLQRIYIVFVVVVIINETTVPAPVPRTVFKTGTICLVAIDGVVVRSHRVGRGI
jgi:hypothetical protein